MALDGRAGIDDLANAPGELAGDELALAAETQLLLAQDRDDDRLQDHDHESDRAQPDALHQDEGQRGEGLAEQEDRLDEGVADEATDRLDLVLDHAGDFGRFDGADILGPKPH